MKTLIIACLFVAGAALAQQAADPETLCETKTSVSTVASFKHCKKGDLVKVGAYEMQRVCELSLTIVPLQNEYVCVYRGAKRAVRERPLTKAEKALEEEHTQSLIEKYTDG